MESKPKEILLNLIFFRRSNIMAKSIADKKKSKEAQIPKLPRGQGNITYREDTDIFVYRKVINGKRKYVYSKTIPGVMKNMQELEENVDKEIKHEKSQTLYEAMMDWLELYKKPTLKKTSYDTLKKTINCRIKDTDIGSARLQNVDSKMIQKHINYLNDTCKYSYSTIKKCYDALHAFYDYMELNDKIQKNPMKVVSMINKENINKETKEISFLGPDDIKKFTEEACEIMPTVNKPKYQYGFCLCANIYLGMRVGELIALKWKDVDLDKNTIFVHENLQRVANPDYDKDNPLDMKRQGILKSVYVTQSLKNYQNRYIHINKKAREYLLLQRKNSDYTKPDDYVCCTREGTHAAVRYLSFNIEAIEKAAGTDVQESGTHMIRHTCASLYFRKGVQIELIAALLGHSVEVCRETYVHFIDEQKREAASLIVEFDDDEPKQPTEKKISKLDDDDRYLAKSLFRVV